MRRHGTVNLGGCGGAARGLTPRQGAAKLLRNFRPGFKNGRKVRLGELVDDDGRERPDRHGDAGSARRMAVNFAKLPELLGRS